MGGPLLGPPVGVPSLVQIGSKLKTFPCYFGEGTVWRAYPIQGASCPRELAPMLPSPAIVLACSQRPKISQSWFYRDMRLPQLGSVVLWLRVFTQLWNLQDMFKTIWRLDLNSIWEYGGRMGGATLWGHIKTYHWGCQIWQGYDAFSPLIVMLVIPTVFKLTGYVVNNIQIRFE